jgi:hypothetical protein
MSAQVGAIIPEYEQKANINRQIVVPTRYSTVKAALRPLMAERTI